jgi:hypothetical protein
VGGTGIDEVEMLYDILVEKYTRENIETINNTLPIFSVSIFGIIWHLFLITN